MPTFTTTLNHLLDPRLVNVRERRGVSRGWIRELVTADGNLRRYFPPSPAMFVKRELCSRYRHRHWLITAIRSAIPCRCAAARLSDGEKC